ncbi:ribonuclease H [Staphylococcus phage SA3]|uniref:RNaseH n=12 Tax=Kayvirus TaxID=1857843 RepID=V5XUN2_BPS25|nr:Rnase H [Staphylococcus phage G15]YP_007112805.1 Rnase H [Staphylococcus phage JD007]YP_008854192.1 Rnase H [Staphylococcus phage S25-3]YP_009099516.1 Rnase H [Staphylococcus phage P108]YP_009195884.1 Rnase H [Staphylococcus phage phiIPLA-RODI]ARM69122.1 ribonuclease [Staphylococcus phage vB_Sau_CG]ARQ96033.1 putative ribonuclease [Staphylococcus phage qdsa002]ASZ77982.1 ribonuclease H [Staphylococcus phage SA3]AUG85710.1 ribonuclease H [Staphylococcus phage HSA30]AXU40011.1 ribonucleas
MQDSVNIYTDGSSSYNKGKVGSGAVLVSKEGNIIAEISKSVDKPGLIKYNNVAGEILACCYGIEEAIKLGYNQAIVYIDYIGLIHWYEGTWSARNILSKTYINMIREYQKVIDINFVKVKSHSNDKWNDYADNLAKKSIDI